MKHFTLIFSVFLSINLFAQQPILKTNFGHKNTSVKISPDSKLLATGDEKGLLKIWDIAKQAELRSISFGKEIKCIQFSSNNNEVFVHAGYENHHVIQYEISTNTVKNKYSLDFDDIVLRSRIFSTKPNILLWGTKDIIILNYQTNEKILALRLKNWDDIQFKLSEDETTFLVIEESLAKVYDINSGKKTNEFKVEGDIEAFDIAPDGKQFITSSKKGPLKIRNTTNGSVIKTGTVDIENFIYTLYYSPDGKYITVFDRNTSIILLYAKDFSVVKSFPNKYYMVYNLWIYDFSNDSKYFIYCDYFHNYIYNIKEDRVLKLNRLSYSIGDVEFLPDTKKILFASIGYTKVFDLVRNDYSKFIKAHKRAITHLKLVDNKSKLISTDFTANQLKIWDVHSLNLLDSLDIDIPVHLRVSNDGKLFIYDKLIDLEKKKPSSLQSSIHMSKDVNASFGNVAFSNDNRSLAYYDYKKNKITVIDRNSGNQIQTISINQKYFGNIYFTPDDKNMIGSGGGKIHIMEINSGKKITEIKTDWPVVSRFVFNSDGTKLAVEVTDNEKMKFLIYNLTNYKVENTIGINVDAEEILKFTPDDKYLICLSREGIAYFIDSETGKEVITFVDVPYTKNWVAVTPDGRFDGTEGGFEYLHFVKGMEIIPLNSLFESYYTPNLLARVLSNENFKEPEVKISELKQPPAVKILSPANNTKTNNKEIEIEVEITDKGGGIDEIRLFHNGKLVEGTARGFKKIVSENESITKTFSLQLVDGENHFKATAFNNQRVEAIPDEATVYYQGQEAKSNLYIIAVGINQYKNQKYNLNYAVKDAEGFENQLKAGSGDIFGNVYSYFIKDNEATKSTIISKLQEIKNKSKQEDVVVFYYAGHGVMSEGVADFPIDFYIVPYDVTQLYGDDEMLNEKAISASQLMELSKEIKAQKQLFVFDACQSGGAMQAFAMRGAAEEKAMAQLARSAGIVVLSASGSEQFATEFNDLGHGTFTYALIEGLQCQADGGTKDRKITVNELKAWIEDRVPELTEKYKGTAQYPTGYSRGQDFPIVICK